MPVWRRRGGFYEGVERPDAVGPQARDAGWAFRRCCGWFFRSEPPTPAEIWRAQAEQRFIAAAAIANHLPADTPPEVVLLAYKEEDGTLTAWEDYHRADAAAKM